ncbi:MAG: hypothetical protein ABMB14_33000 [Myxococcota bacterium]
MGDYDDDGYDDLAIGVRGETADCSNVLGGGAVNILYGTAIHLSATGDVLITQNSPSIDDTAEVWDWFGSDLY